MDIKENTKKIKYSFKKSYGSTSSTFIGEWNFKGKVEYDYYIGFSYFATDEDEYNKLKIQLENETNALINNCLKDIFKKYPMVLNHNREKKYIQGLMGSKDYKLFIKTIIEIILNLDKSEFPFINKMLYELPPVHLYSDFIKLSRFEGHILTPSTLIYNMLKDKIENYIFLNLNLKHLFKIYSSNEADYILRKHQYWSKSQNGECQGRSRKWRSRNETWRRRKERRDTKNLCVYNV